jgi:hypothetical protein
MGSQSTKAILVLSCDKYRDLWNPFFDFFFKYWPDCPYKIYLSSNFIPYERQGVASILSCELTNWSNETILVLNQIKEDHVLVILEDYFIYKRVDHILVEKCFNYLSENNGLFIRLAIFPKDHRELWDYNLTEEEQIGKIKKDQMYPINLQVGIWSKNGLMEIIKEGESPWEFEIEGSKRSNNIGKDCFCLTDTLNLKYVHGPITYLCTAVSRGVWMRDAISLAKKEGIKIAALNRKIENRWTYFKRKIYFAMPFKYRKYMDYIKNLFRCK